MKTVSAPNKRSRISDIDDPNVKNFMRYVSRRNRGEYEFIQAVQEVAETIVPYVEENVKYKEAKILERICEPERVFIFRVPWQDDNGEYQINRGYRVQMNSAIGPYKGGLRLSPTVNLSILKFLAFEQIFKNSLTTLPLGAGKGGSDFDPKGKSDDEVMRFCQSYMTELHKYIGASVDVPAGDVGTGSREIGYMFGQYKRLRNEFVGVLTGKDFSYGGSLIRPEATGFGCVYFANEMLHTRSEGAKNKVAVISGSGNVAQYTAMKLIELGAKVITLSDSGGFIYDKNGLDLEKLYFVMKLKNEQRGRISEYAEQFGCEYYPDEKPWNVPCDLAFPSATENDIHLEDAKSLVKNGCFCIGEGANMPSTPEAIHIFQKHKILYGPGKAANAGGVAVSGLEMAQNSARLSWSKNEVDSKLHDIMTSIHAQCVEHGQNKKYIDYVKGANIAGFRKVANAMMAQGLV